MTTTYKVEGMTCGGCVRSLTAALETSLPDAQIDVQLEGGLVRVVGEHDGYLIEQAVGDAGFEFAGLR